MRFWKKDQWRLSATLENPDIDDPKAFEPAVQLAVLVRFLSAQHHRPLVSSNQGFRQGVSAFQATEMFHVSENVTAVQGVTDGVTARYSLEPHMLQVVAVPMFASFATYNFFSLHREVQFLLAASRSGRLEIFCWLSV